MRRIEPSRRPTAQISREQERRLQQLRRQQAEARRQAQKAEQELSFRERKAQGLRERANDVNQQIAELENKLRRIESFRDRGTNRIIEVDPISGDRARNLRQKVGDRIDELQQRRSRFLESARELEGKVTIAERQKAKRARERLEQLQRQQESINQSGSTTLDESAARQLIREKGIASTERGVLLSSGEIVTPQGRIITQEQAQTPASFEGREITGRDLQSRIQEQQMIIESVESRPKQESGVPVGSGIGGGTIVTMDRGTPVEINVSPQEAEQLSRTTQGKQRLRTLARRADARRQFVEEFERPVTEERVKRGIDRFASQVEEGERRFFEEILVSDTQRVTPGSQQAQEINRRIGNVIAPEGTIRSGAAQFVEEIVTRPFSSAVRFGGALATDPLRTGESIGQSVFISGELAAAATLPGEQRIVRPDINLFNQPDPLTDKSVREGRRIESGIIASVADRRFFVPTDEQGKPIRSESGRFIRAEVTGSDIERRRTDEGIETIETFDIRETVTPTSRGIAIFDTTKQEQGRALAETILIGLPLTRRGFRGLTETELQIRAKLGDSRSKNILELRRKAIETGEPQIAEFTLTEAGALDEFVLGAESKRPGRGVERVEVTPDGTIKTTRADIQQIQRSRVSTDEFGVSLDVVSKTLGRPFSRRRSNIDIRGRTDPETGVFFIEEGIIREQGRVFSKEPRDIEPFETRPQTGVPERISADEIEVPFSTKEGFGLTTIDLRTFRRQPLDVDVTLSKTRPVSEQFEDVTLTSEFGESVAKTPLGTFDVNFKALTSSVDGKGVSSILVEQKQRGARPEERGIIDIASESFEGKRRRSAIQLTIEDTAKSVDRSINEIELPETVVKAKGAFSQLITDDTRATSLFAEFGSRQARREIINIPESGVTITKSDIEGIRVIETGKPTLGIGVSQELLIRREGRFAPEGANVVPDVLSPEQFKIEIPEKIIPERKKFTSDIRSIYTKPDDVVVIEPSPGQKQLQKRTKRLGSGGTGLKQRPRTALSRQLVESQVVEVIQRQQSRTLSGISSLGAETLSSILDTKSLAKTRQSLGVELISIQRQQTRQLERQQTRQLERQQTRQLERQQTRQLELQREIQSTIGSTNNIIPTGTSEFTTSTGRGRRAFIPFDFDRGLTSQRRGGFVPEVKVRGKFVKPRKTPLTRVQAQRLGRRLVDNTSARSFRIVPQKGNVSSRRVVDAPPATKFRPSKSDPNTRVERVDFAIDSAGERRQITEKGLRARARKGLSSPRKSRSKNNILSEVRNILG